MPYEYPKPGALTINREFRAPTYPSVRVRVLQPFYGLRRLLAVGEVCDLTLPDAEDARALGRCEWI